MKNLLHTKKKKVNVKLITLKTKITFQRGPCPLEAEYEASFLFGKNQILEKYSRQSVKPRYMYLFI